MKWETDEIGEFMGCLRLLMKGGEDEDDRFLFIHTQLSLAHILLGEVEVKGKNTNILRHTAGLHLGYTSYLPFNLC